MMVNTIVYVLDGLISVENFNDYDTAVLRADEMSKKLEKDNGVSFRKPSPNCWIADNSDDVIRIKTTALRRK